MTSVSGCGRMSASAARASCHVTAAPRYTPSSSLSIRRRSGTCPMATTCGRCRIPLVTHRPTSVAPATIRASGSAIMACASASALAGMVRRPAGPSHSTVAPSRRARSRSAISPAMASKWSGPACMACRMARTIGAYPVQRHRLPASMSSIACSSCASSSALRPATMDMTKPGVQKPHCEPCWSTMACCTGCRLPSGARMSSMVRICAPSSMDTNWMHALTARQTRRSPSSRTTSTVQAPQSPSLQPSLVPVRPRSSRSQSSSVRVGTTSANVWHSFPT